MKTKLIILFVLVVLTFLSWGYIQRWEINRNLPKELVEIQYRNPVKDANQDEKAFTQFDQVVGQTMGFHALPTIQQRLNP